MRDFEVEELAHRAMGKDAKETEEALEKDNSSIDDELWDTYEVTFEYYKKIVQDLMQFTPLIQSPLSKKAYHAFVDTKESRAIVKIEANI